MRQMPVLTQRVTRLLSKVLLVALIAAAGGPLFNVAAAPFAATNPTLGVAATYSILAGSQVTNTGITTISGDIGISPGIGSPPHYINTGTVNNDAHKAVQVACDARA